MKYLLSFFFGLSVLLGSAFVQANDVGDEMDVIAKSYRTLLNTDSLDEFKQELAKMREATVKAADFAPKKLKDETNNSASMEDYRHGLTALLQQIDQAAQLADAGKLDEAKQVAEKFKDTRNEYHKKYK